MRTSYICGRLPSLDALPDLPPNLIVWRPPSSEHPPPPKSVQQQIRQPEIRPAELSAHTCVSARVVQPNPGLEALVRRQSGSKKPIWGRIMMLAREWSPRHHDTSTSSQRPGRSPCQERAPPSLQVASPTRLSLRLGPCNIPRRRGRPAVLTENDVP